MWKTPSMFDFWIMLRISIISKHYKLNRDCHLQCRVKLFLKATSSDVFLQIYFFHITHDAHFLEQCMPNTRKHCLPVGTVQPSEILCFLILCNLVMAPILKLSLKKHLPALHLPIFWKQDKDLAKSLIESYSTNKTKQIHIHLYN